MPDDAFNRGLGPFRSGTLCYSSEVRITFFSEDVRFVCFDYRIVLVWCLSSMVRGHLDMDVFFVDGLVQ